VTTALTNQGRRFFGGLEIALTAMVLSMLGVLWATSAEVSASENESVWFGGVGKQTITTSSGVIVRDVEAWISSEGQYRVIVSTPDFGGSEEVIYDGNTQRAIVTPPGAKAKSVTVVGATNEHFVAQSFEALKSWDSDQATSGSIESTMHGSERLAMTWKTIAGSTELLVPSGGVFPAVSGQKDGLFIVDPEPVSIHGGGGQTSSYTSHTGPNTETMFGPGGACVAAYNFRNLTTGYFRATSSKTGVCYYMMVSLYRNSLAQGGGGFCLFSGYGGSSGALANFASRYTYTTPSYPANSATCSAHTGWKSNWSQQVTARGMNGYPN